MNGEKVHDTLIEFLRPGIEPVDVRRFVLDWLHTHPGTGGAGSFDNCTSQDRDVKHADLCRQVLGAMVSTKDTIAQQYLRAIRGDWQPGLAGYVDDDERPGEGAIVGIITDAHGAPAGIQVGSPGSFLVGKSKSAVASAGPSSLIVRPLGCGSTWFLQCWTRWRRLSSAKV